MEERTADPRFDSRGCLSPAGVAAFAHAPAGRAPVELASHVATCLSCQERLLAGESPRPRDPSAQRRPQPLRTAMVLVLLLLGAFVALYTTRWMIGY